MLKPLRTVIDFIVYSNLYIALGAVAMVYTTRWVLGEALYFDKVCWFVLFATALAYSLLKYEREDKPQDETAHITWANRHPQMFRNVLLICAIGAGALFLQLDFDAKVMVVILGLFTAFYGFLWIPWGAKKYRLRELGLVKTLFVGLVWSFTTVLIPVAGQHIATDTLVFLLLRRFLFISALTVPFEIKDLAIDKATQIKTIPQVIGISGTKLLAQGMLLLIILINAVQYFFYDMPFGNMIAFDLSLLISIACIQPVKEGLSDKWYYLVLDGMMLLQFLLIFIAGKFFMS